MSSVECKVRSVKCKVRSVKCATWLQLGLFIGPLVARLLSGDGPGQFQDCKRLPATKGNLKFACI